MTAVMVEIQPSGPVGKEPEGVVFLDDVEALAEGATPGCNDDNPYR